MKNSKSCSGKKPQSKKSHQSEPHDDRCELCIRSKFITPLQLDPRLLADADWFELAQQLGKSGGIVTVRAKGLLLWPDHARYMLFCLLRQLPGRYRLRLGGRKYTDAFEAALSLITGSQSMEEHRTAMRAVLEAAAVFHADIPDEAAGRINARLQAVGSTKIPQRSLVKQLRGVAGQRAGENNGDPAKEAATSFVIHMRDDEGLAPDAPVLRYFQQEWYAWRGTCWVRLDDANMSAKVMRFLQTGDFHCVTKRILNDVLEHLRAIALLDCWSESMPFYVASDSPLQIERPNWLVFGNGRIDLQAVIEGTAPDLVEIDASYFNEIVLPFDYDPGAECPLWLATLDTILPKTSCDDNRVLVLQEFLGYVWLPDCRFQKMLILCGPGGNGKSTITTPIQAMLGKDNVSNVPLEKLGDEFRTFQLKGKLANFAGELPYLGQVNEGHLKMIVSGEAIDANRKHKDPVRLRTSTKLVVNTNELPQIRDATYATFDRLITMPFEVRIRGTCHEDKQRAAKLLDELPGIFNWSLEGLKRLLQQGGFTPCCKCQALLTQHRIESDSPRQFCSEMCVTSHGSVTLSRPLYDLYRYWCERSGRKALAESEFGKRLTRMGWQKGREPNGPYRRPLYRRMKLTAAGQEMFEAARKLGRCHEQQITFQLGPLPQAGTG